MPIFTSKFSPNRSLIGNFLASVARKKDEAKSEPEKARTDSAQPSQDRLELSGQAPASQPVPASPADAARLQTPAIPTQAQEASSVRPETPAIAQPQAQDNPADRPANPLETIQNRADNARAEKALLAVARENEAAAESVQSEESAPESLAGGLPQVSAETRTAESQGNLTALATRIAEQRAERTADQPASAPPPREAQKAELQGNLKTIATGLQADAVEENRRNSEQTAQTQETASRRDQQRALRDNQSDIQALQSDRRRMEQETQRADQAIRQLQSENARLRNRASNVGTTLDLLAV